MKIFEKEDYISLKEAARISGYAPDYIGQLIRQGKIQGKQIYTNIAWVTTEKAILDYKGHEEDAAKEGRIKRAFHLLVQFFRKDAVQGKYIVLQSSLYIVVALLSISLFALFYALSVNIDRRIQDRASERIPPIEGILETRGI